MYFALVYKKRLLQFTRYMVADAYFSKSTFMSGTLDMGFYVISHFHDDTYFGYLTTAPYRQK